jgi:hypothetical protein
LKNERLSFDEEMASSSFFFRKEGDLATREEDGGGIVDPEDFAFDVKVDAQVFL